MSASDTVPVIVGAAIGAGGAVAAQITTAIATARRERSRLDWEKQRQDREWKVREEERSLTLKQELYTSYAVAANEFLSYINTVFGINELPGKPTPEPELESFKRIKSNIEFVAPEEVSNQTNACYIRIVNVLWGMNISNQSNDEQSRDILKREFQTAVDAWWDAYGAMRRDLHGDKQRFKEPALKIVDIPPDKRPARVRWWWRAIPSRRTPPNN